MAKNPIRDTRETEPISGVGGFLKFAWKSFLYEYEDVIQVIDVRQWEGEHILHKISLPLSGGHGSLSKRRVCDDFTFKAVVDLDLTPIKKESPRPGDRQPCYDGRLEGHKKNNFLISAVFQIGDPTFTSHPNWQTIARPHPNHRADSIHNSGVYLTCKEVLIDRVHLLNSVSEGRRVITCIVEGSGSASVQRYVDGDWCGGGAFGIAQDIQLPPPPA